MVNYFEFKKDAVEEILAALKESHPELYVKYKAYVEDSTHKVFDSLTFDMVEDHIPDDIDVNILFENYQKCTTDVIDSDIIAEVISICSDGADKDLDATKKLEEQCKSCAYNRDIDGDSVCFSDAPIHIAMTYPCPYYDRG